MSDQVRISDPENCVICGLSLDDHWLASCPDVAGDPVERTWDGEPLWSVETQQEGLFAGDAFEQMSGQMAIRCHDDIPPKWLDELDPEAREYAEEFEVAHCNVCGGYIP